MPLAGTEKQGFSATSSCHEIRDRELDASGKGPSPSRADTVRFGNWANIRNAPDAFKNMLNTRMDFQGSALHTHRSRQSWNINAVNSRSTSFISSHVLVTRA